MGVIVLELEIRHVLKGYHVGSHFTSVVVPEGIAFIRTDYHIGDEVIVSAIYWKYMRGGSYTVTNDAGCFRKSGDKWLNALVISPNPPVEVELSEIEKVIASCRPEALLRIVEVAAIVRVESVSPTRPATSNAVPAPTGRHGFSTGASSAVTVEANVMDIIAGSAKGDTVIFHSIGTQFEVGQDRDCGWYSSLGATRVYTSPIQRMASFAFPAIRFSKPIVCFSRSRRTFSSRF